MRVQESPTEAVAVFPGSCLPTLESRQGPVSLIYYKLQCSLREHTGQASTIDNQVRHGVRCDWRLHGEREDRPYRAATKLARPASTRGETRRYLDPAVGQSQLAYATRPCLFATGSATSADPLRASKHNWSFSSPPRLMSLLARKKGG